MVQIDRQKIFDFLKKQDDVVYFNDLRDLFLNENYTNTVVSGSDQYCIKTYCLNCNAYLENNYSYKYCPYCGLPLKNI